DGFMPANGRAVGPASGADIHNLPTGKPAPVDMPTVNDRRVADRSGDIEATSTNDSPADGRPPEIGSAAGRAGEGAGAGDVPVEMRNADDGFDGFMPANGRAVAPASGADIHDLPTGKPAPVDMPTVNDRRVADRSGDIEATSTIERPADGERP